MQDIVMKDYPKTLLIVFTAAKVIPLLNNFKIIFITVLLRYQVGSGSDLERAQRRVAPTNGCESRHGKSRKPCSLDGRGWWKRYLLKPIDKVPQGGMSNYPGCNESERRSSLVKIDIHWPNLFNLGEGRTYEQYWDRHYLFVPLFLRPASWQGA